MEDAEGFVAWSECVAGELPNYSPETVDTSWLAIRDWLAPRVLGVGFPVRRRGARPRATPGPSRAPHGPGQRSRWGSWCLLALRSERSLSATVAGTRERVGTGISLGIQASPEALVEKATEARDRGYKKIKIKIKPGRDLEYISAVRSALGPDAPLMADANNAYTLDDLDHLAELDRFGLIMIEQPLAWDDVVRHAELQKRLKTRVCLDESISSLQRAEDMIEYQAGRIINIKPGRVGGFLESKAIHDLCARHEIPVWCGGMLETGIGRSYNVALASLPNFTIPGDISPSDRYWKRDIVTPEWTMDDQGWVEVPTTAGLGVEVDVDRIDDLTVRKETVR